MGLKSETVRVFQTGQICRFAGEDSNILVAYQMDQHGCHRIAMVGEDGKVIVAGALAPYQLPVFVVIGTMSFMAVSQYFEGETITTETVYRLEHGDLAGQGTSVEEDGEDDEEEDAEESEAEDESDGSTIDCPNCHSSLGGQQQLPEIKCDMCGYIGEDPTSASRVKPLAIVEPESPTEPVEGWYIESLYVEEHGMDEVMVVVRMCHTDLDDYKEISEELHPGNGELREIRHEEHGGKGKVQQSIVIVAENIAGIEAEIQVEIDYETGEFKEDSLRGWDKS